MLKTLLIVLILTTAFAQCMAYNQVAFSYPATDDSTVYSGNKTKNYDSSSSSADVNYLWAGTKTSSGDYRSYLKFDFSNFSSSSRITKAYLRLYAESHNSLFCHVDACDPGNVTWTEGTISWNTQSSWTLSQADQLKIDNGGTTDNRSVYKWDVTPEARTAQSGASSIVSLALQNAAEGSTGFWAKFHSRENPGGNAITYHPELLIYNSYCTVDGYVYEQINPSIPKQPSNNASVTISASDGWTTGCPATTNSNGRYSGVNLYVGDGCDKEKIYISARKTGWAGSSSWNGDADDAEHGSVTMSSVIDPMIDIRAQLDTIAIPTDPGSQFATPAFVYQGAASTPVNTSGYTMNVSFNTDIYNAISVEPEEPFDQGFSSTIDNVAGTVEISGETSGGAFVLLSEDANSPTPLCDITWELIDTIPGDTCLDITECAFTTSMDPAFAIRHRTCLNVLPLEKTITVTDPDGGEVLRSGTEYEINWEGSEGVSIVSIELEDPNETFTPIALVDDTGSYNWTVPDVPDGEYLIRISDAQDPNIIDTSDSFFDIFTCTLKSDSTGDCTVNMPDLNNLSSEWLQSQTGP